MWKRSIYFLQFLEEHFTKQLAQKSSIVCLQHILSLRDILLQYCFAKDMLFFHVDRIFPARYYSFSTIALCDNITQKFNCHNYIFIHKTGFSVKAHPGEIIVSAVAIRILDKCSRRDLPPASDTSIFDFQFRYVSLSGPPAFSFMTCRRCSGIQKCVVHFLEYIAGAQAFRNASYISFSAS